RLRPSCDGTEWCARPVKGAHQFAGLAAAFEEPFFVALPHRYGHASGSSPRQKSDYREAAIGELAIFHCNNRFGRSALSLALNQRASMERTGVRIVTVVP